MDDLDRLFRRLVHNVRGGFPHLLSRQFQLSDIAQHLVPYRHNRRELGLETNQDYEHALLRLVSGERGYLAADLTVQEAARRELASADPDPDLLRTHGSALVSLSPDAVADVEGDGSQPADATAAHSAAPSAPASASASSPADGDRRAAELASTSPPASAPPPAAAPASASPAAAPDAEPTGRSTPSMPWSERVHILTLTPDGVQRSAPGAPPQQQSASDSMSQQHPANASDTAATPSGARPAASQPSTFPESADGYVAPSGRSAPAVVGGGTCRYCGGNLPEGRRVTFCPTCGQNVTIIQCPACSTELELGWKFCITCGRGADATDAARAP